MYIKPTAHQIQALLLTGCKTRLDIQCNNCAILATEYLTIPRMPGQMSAASFREVSNINTLQAWSITCSH